MQQHLSAFSTREITFCNPTKPYLGVKKDKALELLETAPLTVTTAEAEAIDKAVKSAHLATVKLKYDAASKEKNFLGSSV